MTQSVEANNNTAGSECGKPLALIAHRQTAIRRSNADTTGTSSALRYQQSAMLAKCLPPHFTGVIVGDFNTQHE